MDSAAFDLSSPSPLSPLPPLRPYSPCKTKRFLRVVLHTKDFPPAPPPPAASATCSSDTSSCESASTFPTCKDKKSLAAERAETSLCPSAALQPGYLVLHQSPAKPPSLGSSAWNNDLLWAELPQKESYFLTACGLNRLSEKQADMRSCTDLYATTTAAAAADRPEGSDSLPRRRPTPHHDKPPQSSGFLDFPSSWHGEPAACSAALSSNSDDASSLASSDHYIHQRPVTLCAAVKTEAIANATIDGNAFEKREFEEASSSLSEPPPVVVVAAAAAACKQDPSFLVSNNSASATLSQSSLVLTNGTISSTSSPSLQSNSAAVLWNTDSSTTTTATSPVGSSKPSLDSSVISSTVQPTQVSQMLRRLVSNGSQLTWQSQLRFVDGQYQQHALSDEQRHQQLSELLFGGHPHVFLERHGHLLTESELRSIQKTFAQLYEVQYYVEKLLEKLPQRCFDIPTRPSTPDSVKSEPMGTSVLPPPKPSSKEHKLSKVQQNRRFKRMKALSEEGVYFSLESMKDRQPALFEELLGNYSESQLASVSSTPASPSTTSGSLLTSAASPASTATKPPEPPDKKYKVSDYLFDCMQKKYRDKQIAKERRQWELQDRHLVTIPRKLAHRESETQPTGGSPNPLDVVPQKANGSASGHETPNEGFSMLTPQNGYAAIQEELSTVPVGHRDPKTEESLPNASSDEQKENTQRALVDDTQELIWLMQQRFLAGQDTAYTNYEEVDNDEGLDDFKQMEIDQEDEYFDSEAPS